MSNLFNKVLSTASVVAVQMGLSSAVYAGPGLSYYYNYLNDFNMAECIDKGYQALANRSLQYPSNTYSDEEFAIGENETVTLIVDCSEASRNGKITVMASSNEPEIADDYARSILDDISRDYY